MTLMHPENILDIARKYGVELHSDFDVMPPLTPVSATSLADFNAKQPTVLSEALFWQSGRPGTRVIGGRVAVEPNANMRPFQARGVSGSIGVFDELFREPIVYKSVTTLSNIIKTGNVTLEFPDSLMRRSDVDDIRAKAVDLFARFKGIEGGWSKFMEEASTCILKGFSIFEVVYTVDSAGRIVPEKLAFREQSTVDRWITDEHARYLAAVEFRPGGDKSSSYTLPARGPSTPHSKVLLCNVQGHGLNFEGISPARTIRLLVDCKKLILAIIPASAERFGCPVAIVEAHDGVYSMARAQIDKEGLDDVMAVFEYMQALDTPTIKMPIGATARYLSPENVAPDFIAMLNYIDQQIAQVFATQAQQLGHSSTGGSYALGAVQESDLMRAAPAYASCILDPVNQLFQRILRTEYHVSAIELPYMVFGMQETIDVSRVLSDLKTFLEIKDKLPPAVRRKVSEMMGYDPDAFDQHEES